MFHVIRLSLATLIPNGLMGMNTADTRLACVLHCCSCSEVCGPQLRIHHRRVRSVIRRVFSCFADLWYERDCTRLPAWVVWVCCCTPCMLIVLPCDLIKLPGRIWAPNRRIPIRNGPRTRPKWPGASPPVILGSFWVRFLLGYDELGGQIRPGSSIKSPRSTISIHGED
jgi:hypothetical protein